MTASLLRRPRASRTPTTDTTVTATTDGKPGLGARVLQSAVRLGATALMVAAVAAFLFLAVGPRILGYQTSTMLTGSMAPLINPGDVVITVPVPVADLKVGDIITYHIPVDDQRVETHRIIELAVNSQGTATVRTKGDANNGADPGRRPWQRARWTGRSSPSRTWATPSGPCGTRWS
ncbi:signal peptidase I [Arthrobacter sp. NA-172]|uniref:signal peptidase I n=1 Tax=Arthrobacter sp. NA-172 TaxID=3367524 RepID=UPI003755088B